MKKLTCEMCGSTDMLKQDGVFVCQSCGTKYSVEEARKLMVEIEGTVEIQGTVKVDNSDAVQKYLFNARRALQKEDWEEVEKYYNLVEQNDPQNIEAIFYSAYGKAQSTLISDDIYKREAAFKVLAKCISVLDDNYDASRGDENKQAITNIAKDLGNMITSTFVYTQWQNGYGITTKDNKDQTYLLFANLIDAYRDTMVNIQKVDNQIYMHEASIRLYETAKNISLKRWSCNLDKWIQQEFEAIRKINDPKTHIITFNYNNSESSATDGFAKKFLLTFKDAFSLSTGEDIQIELPNQQTFTISDGDSKKIILKDGFYNVIFSTKDKKHEIQLNINKNITILISVNFKKITTDIEPF